MIRFGLRRLFYVVPVLFLVATIAFMIVEIDPGSPAEHVAGPGATDEDVARIEEQLGLNDPPFQRYVNYLGDIVRADFGTSYSNSLDVTTILHRQAAPTVSLLGVAFVTSLGLGVPLGMVSALNKGSVIDRLASILAAISFTVPGFVVGIFLLRFLALQLGWLPATGYESIGDAGLWGWLSHLLIPAFALALYPLSEIARVLRTSMIETMDRAFVDVARAKGVRETRVVFKHAFKNAAVPLVTVLGVQAGRLIGASVIVEQIFNIPGWGSLAFQAATTSNLPVLQGLVLTVAVLILTANLCIEVLYAYLNPRLRAA